MKRFFHHFKNLPVSTKRLLGLGLIVGFTIALPLFIWAVVTQNFNLSERAQVIPSTCVADINNVINVVPSGDSTTCHDLQTAIDAVSGDGYTILIEPGTYDITSTVNVNGKSNLTITGESEAGSNAAVINSIAGNGWGILVENSSGSIQWLSMAGGSSNGMLSIHNSNNFSVSYTSLYSQSSHTLDIEGSNNISVFNTEIQSSAGALEIYASNDITIGNNKIHNSNNAISINNVQNIQLFGNLVYSNRENGIRTQDISNINANHNTFYNNGTNGFGFPAIDVTGNVGGQVSISDNIVAFNNGGGLNFSGTTSNVYGSFERNDIYGNSTDYVGVPNQTGLNGNISQNPLINTESLYSYCLYSNSPAIYGDVSQFEFMGYIGSCGFPAPAPTATPTITPTPTATATPTTSENTYDNPNSCNGTCGSNSNCQANYFCYQGRCRNPSCENDSTCGCKTATSTPTAKPVVKKVSSPTPEVVIYKDKTAPKPTSIAVVNENFVSSPLPSPTLTPKQSNKLDFKYIAIIVFSVIALLFGFSVLLDAMKKPPITPPPPQYPV